MQSWLRLNRKPQINIANNEKCQKCSSPNHQSEFKCMFLMDINGWEIFKFLAFRNGSLYCSHVINVVFCVEMKTGSGELRKEGKCCHMDYWIVPILFHWQNQSCSGAVFCCLFKSSLALQETKMLSTMLKSLWRCPKHTVANPLLWMTLLWAWIRFWDGAGDSQKWETMHVL